MHTAVVLEGSGEKKSSIFEYFSPLKIKCGTGESGAFLKLLFYAYQLPGGKPENKLKKTSHISGWGRKKDKINISYALICLGKCEQHTTEIVGIRSPLLLFF